MPKHCETCSCPDKSPLVSKGTIAEMGSCHGCGFDVLRSDDKVWVIKCSRMEVRLCPECLRLVFAQTRK